MFVHLQEELCQGFAARPRRDLVRKEAVVQVVVVHGCQAELALTED